MKNTIVVLGSAVLLAYAIYALFLKSDSDTYATYVNAIEADLSSRDCIGVNGRLFSMGVFIGTKPGYQEQFIKYEKSVYERIEEMKRSGACV
ncbi:MAG: hypothetical protein GXP13_06340 [Gammaproteobacteria bacterium]|nr:hypothetical protein [Gammaproteobacteria bacterium]